MHHWPSCHQSQLSDPVQNLVGLLLPWSMTWLCPTTMEGLVGHWCHNQLQGSIHAPTKRYQPIVCQEVLQMPKRQQSQIYCQKWHGTVERCVPCQHLILKAREKIAGQRNQGRDLDKPADSTWVFSFHPEAMHQAHTQGIQKHGRNKVCCQHVAPVTIVC